MTKAAAPQASALLKQPLRVLATLNGQKLAEQVFQHTPIRMGRLTDNDLVFPFDFVSRHHCELHFANGQWKAIDLGSKNGIVNSDSDHVDELELQSGDVFRIQDLHVQIVIEEVEKTDFHSLREAQTIIASEDDLQPAKEFGKSPRKPLLDLRLQDLLQKPHPGAPGAKARGVQVIVFWHEQLLEFRELGPGAPLIFELHGQTRELGVIRSEKTKIRVPSLLKSLNGDEGKTAVLTPERSLAFRTDEGLTVVFRYVPRSEEIAGSFGWVEDKLLDPLIASSAIHGAVAITTLLAPAKPPSKPVEEPERFAKILFSQPALPVAAQPTPTPQPRPSPAPQIAKVEKKPEVPRIKPKEIKKIVSEKKLRALAIARKEEAPAEEQETTVKITSDIAPRAVPRAAVKPFNKEVQRVVQAKPPPPVPTPVFEAKKVGALKMLSMFNAEPTVSVANVEKLKVTRAPANVEGENGTQEIEKNLTQSTKNMETLKEAEAATSLMPSTKGATYKLAGLSQKAGQRQIRGTVVGGATYSELAKNEGLKRSQVSQVVQEHQGEIQTCYERALIPSPDLSGRAEIEWEISPQGDVTSVRVKETTLKNAETLLDCVKAVFSRMRFPAAKNGESTTPTIGLPFGRI